MRRGALWIGGGEEGKLCCPMFLGRLGFSRGPKNNCTCPKIVYWPEDPPTAPDISNVATGCASGQGRQFKKKSGGAVAKCGSLSGLPRYWKTGKKSGICHSLFSRSWNREFSRKPGNFLQSREKNSIDKVLFNVQERQTTYFKALFKRKTKT